MKTNKLKLLKFNLMLFIFISLFLFFSNSVYATTTVTRTASGGLLPVNIPGAKTCFWFTSAGQEQIKEITTPSTGPFPLAYGGISDWFNCEYATAVTFTTSYPTAGGGSLTGSVSGAQTDTPLTVKVLSYNQQDASWLITCPKTPNPQDTPEYFNSSAHAFIGGDQCLASTSSLTTTITLYNNYSWSPGYYSGSQVHYPYLAPLYVAGCLCQNGQTAFAEISNIIVSNIGTGNVINLGFSGSAQDTNFQAPSNSPYNISNAYNSISNIYSGVPSQPQKGIWTWNVKYADFANAPVSELKQTSTHDLNFYFTYHFWYPTIAPKNEPPLCIPLPVPAIPAPWFLCLEQYTCNNKYSYTETSAINSIQNSNILVPSYPSNSNTQLNALTWNGVQVLPFLIYNLAIPITQSDINSNSLLYLNDSFDIYSPHNFLNPANYIDPYKIDLNSSFFVNWKNPNNGKFQLDQLPSNIISVNYTKVYDIVTSGQFSSSSNWFNNYAKTLFLTTEGNKFNNNAQTLNNCFNQNNAGNCIAKLTSPTTSPSAGFSPVDSASSSPNYNLNPSYSQQPSNYKPFLGPFPVNNPVYMTVTPNGNIYIINETSANSCFLWYLCIVSHTKSVSETLTVMKAIPKGFYNLSVYQPGILAGPIGLPSNSVSTWETTWKQYWKTVIPQQANTVYITYQVPITKGTVNLGSLSTVAVGTGNALGNAWNWAGNGLKWIATKLPWAGHGIKLLPASTLSSSSSSSSSICSGTSTSTINIVPTAITTDYSGDLFLFGYNSASTSADTNKIVEILANPPSGSSNCETAVINNPSTPTSEFAVSPGGQFAYIASPLIPNNVMVYKNLGPASTSSSYKYSCPNGGSVSGTNCIVAANPPTCASGFSYNTRLKICVASPTPPSSTTCPSGSSYNTLYKVCVASSSASWTCPSSSETLDSASETCTYAATGTKSTPQDFVFAANIILSYSQSSIGTFNIAQWLAMGGPYNSSQLKAVYSPSDPIQYSFHIPLEIFDSKGNLYVLDYWGFEVGNKGPSAILMLQAFSGTQQLPVNPFNIFDYILNNNQNIGQILNSSLVYPPYGWPLSVNISLGSSKFISYCISGCTNLAANLALTPSQSPFHTNYLPLGPFIEARSIGAPSSSASIACTPPSPPTTPCSGWTCEPSSGKWVCSGGVPTTTSPSTSSICKGAPPTCSSSSDVLHCSSTGVWECLHLSSLSVPTKEVPTSAASSTNLINPIIQSSTSSCSGDTIENPGNCAIGFTTQGCAANVPICPVLIPKQPPPVLTLSSSSISAWFSHIGITSFGVSVTYNQTAYLLAHEAATSTPYTELLAFDINIYNYSKASYFGSEPYTCILNHDIETSTGATGTLGKNINCVEMPGYGLSNFYPPLIVMPSAFNYTENLGSSLKYITLSNILSSFPTIQSCVSTNTASLTATQTCASSSSSSPPNYQSAASATPPSSPLTSAPQQITTINSSIYGYDIIPFNVIYNVHQTWTPGIVTGSLQDIQVPGLIPTFCYPMPIPYPAVFNLYGINPNNLFNPLSISNPECITDELNGITPPPDCPKTPFFNGNINFGQPPEGIPGPQYQLISSIINANPLLNSTTPYLCNQKLSINSGSSNEITNCAAYTAKAVAATPNIISNNILNRIEGGQTFLQDVISNNYYIANLSDAGMIIPPNLKYNLFSDRLFGETYINASIMPGPYIANPQVITSAKNYTYSLVKFTQSGASGTSYPGYAVEQSNPVNPVATGMSSSTGYYSQSYPFAGNKIFTYLPFTTPTFLNITQLYKYDTYKNSISLDLSNNKNMFGYNRLIYTFVDRFNNTIFMPLDVDFANISTVSMNSSETVNPSNTNQTSITVNGLVGFMQGSTFKTINSGNIYLYYDSNINYYNINNGYGPSYKGYYTVADVCSFGLPFINCQVANPLAMFTQPNCATGTYANIFPQYICEAQQNNNNEQAQDSGPSLAGTINYYSPSSCKPPSNSMLTLPSFNCNIYGDYGLPTTGTLNGHQAYCVPDFINGTGVLTTQLGLIKIVPITNGQFAYTFSACGTGTAKIIATYYGDPGPEPQLIEQSNLSYSSGQYEIDMASYSPSIIHPTLEYNYANAPNSTAISFPIGSYLLSFGNISILIIIILSVILIILINLLKKKK